MMTVDEENKFDFITTQKIVDEYNASIGVFNSLLKEVKELSKKKPDATMSNAKVAIVNRVLENLLTVLEGQPEEKYLEILSDEELPQVSDAVLVMVQFDTALHAFKQRHTKILGFDSFIWITDEYIIELKEKYKSDYEEYDEDDDKY